MATSTVNIKVEEVYPRQGPVVYVTISASPDNVVIYKATFRRRKRNSRSLQPDKKLYWDGVAGFWQNIEKIPLESYVPMAERAYAIFADRSRSV